MTCKPDLKLLKAIQGISMNYKKDSSLPPEIACQRFGVSTRAIDELVEAMPYQSRKDLLKALNTLVKEGHIIKSVEVGQQAKWMTVADISK